MNFCSIFVSIIIVIFLSRVTKPVINVVPAGTDIKLIVIILLIMLLTVFVLQFIPAQNSLLFSSHGISVCRFPLTSPNLVYKLQM